MCRKIKFSSANCREEKSMQKEICPYKVVTFKGRVNGMKHGRIEQLRVREHFVGSYIPL